MGFDFTMLDTASVMVEGEGERKGHVGADYAPAVRETTAGASAAQTGLHGALGVEAMGGYRKSCSLSGCSCWGQVGSAGAVPARTLAVLGTGAMGSHRNSPALPDSLQGGGGGVEQPPIAPGTELQLVQLLPLW